MTVAGLPLHPLVVHAAVVFIPLTALLAVVFAVASRWRWLTRWPTVVLSLGVVALGFLATTSGASLAQRVGPFIARAVRVHAERGHALSWVLVGFAGLVLLGAWSLPGTTALASGKGAWQSRMPALEKVMPAVLVLAALAVLVLVLLVGDSGARVVWAGVG